MYNLYRQEKSDENQRNIRRAECKSAIKLKTSLYLIRKKR
jgi:hypothetical protein